jgi:hypothetical protein
MSAKCANAACPQVLRDCRVGRFFRFVSEGEGSRIIEGEATTEHHGRGAEYYWLCERCARIYTLVCVEGAGVTLKPRWKDLAAAEIIKEIGVA